MLKSPLNHTNHLLWPGTTSRCSRGKTDTKGHVAIAGLSLQAYMNSLYTRISFRNFAVDNCCDSPCSLVGFAFRLFDLPDSRCLSMCTSAGESPSGVARRAHLSLPRRVAQRSTFQILLPTCQSFRNQTCQLSPEFYCVTRSL